MTASGLFAARPSDAENIYKIYAESFKDLARLDAIVSEAQRIVNNALETSSADLKHRGINNERRQWMSSYLIR